DLRIIPIIVNGQKVKFPDSEPYINTDGFTMVPIRFVSEKLGADVKWNNKTQTAIIAYKGQKIEMQIGSKNAVVDGEAVTLDTAAEKYEGRTMVPLRFVSEVLHSDVKWDAGAHSVRVTDAEYQKKVDSGKVVLDPWGREYSKKWDANWMKLTDLPDRFYQDINVGKPNNRQYMAEKRSWDYKTYADQWAERIKQFYASSLNVDYRTFNEKKFADNAIKYMGGEQGLSSIDIQGIRDVAKFYAGWVKKNKVIVKGYADPEMSQVREAGGFVIVRTRFKFMVISANDTSQVFPDNTDVTKRSDSFKLKKNVWYDGYSDVYLATNSFNYQHEYFSVYYFENMFLKGRYFYEVSE
uniref:copper amine oxidase N-terminal domain-containing protein n=1 Tax=Paenibacillus xylaniclasticus TaxID=588083 RepID=UPI0013E0ACCE